ncbi:MAG: glycosyltransferase family 4 protein [Alphaproteobacteria bacterium]|nr:glycosyltransferase family 4 protein [Alphaproteobacteria bacterium]
MTITCVHQGYELYGSDRVFVQSVKSLRERFPSATIRVLLPARGALASQIERLGCTIEIQALWVLRRRDILNRVVFGLPSLIRAVARARRQIQESDLTYVSTSVVFDFLCAARLNRKPVIVHVHELPQGKVLQVLRGLVAWSGAHVIFNSKATQKAFGLERRPGLALANGCSPPVSQVQSNYDGTRPLRVLMIGRINRWKGQPLLIDAVREVVRENRGVEVRIVGGTFESPALRDLLVKQIEDHDLSDTITVEDFLEDTSPLYHWSDVVVVPSLAPEPFGLVAIEAMAHGRPVIAAAHGGLLEIVNGRKTGWLFAPGDRGALARTILEAIRNPQLVLSRGNAARKRYEIHFTEARYADRFKGFVDEILGADGGRVSRRPTL